MSNVISIFSKRDKTPAPSDLVVKSLKQTMKKEGYKIESKFTQSWDSAAKLWQLRVQVSHPASETQDMVFWYEGESPRFAIGVEPGKAVAASDAAKVIVQA